MTVVTSVAACNVRRRLAGCNITVVTGLATANDLRMVHHNRRRPEVYAMAILANSRCLNVSHVFPGGFAAVVTIGTIPGDACVIEGCWCPRDRCVAIITVVATGEVRRVFSRRGNTVMTRTTTAKYLRMIHPVCWLKSDRVMTVFANIGCLYVRLVLASRLRSVVTTNAVAGDVDVVKVGWGPARRQMAVTAVIAAGDMVRVFARRNRSIVAGATRAEHAVVIHRECRREGIGRMAIFTNIGGQNVGWILANCVGTVVAGHAISGDVRMVKNCGRPRRCIVAVIALLAGCDMRWCLTSRLHTVVT